MGCHWRLLNRGRHAMGGSAIHQKSMHTKIKVRILENEGGQPGNHNALYNAGGAPKQNQNAVKHGLLAKYLPKETLDIVMEVEESSPIDILYMNIKSSICTYYQSTEADVC